MLIWILALVLFGLIGVLGFYQGAIRFLVSAAGFVAALFLAVPLALITKFLVPLIGVTGNFWPWALPLLVGFLLVYGIGIGLSFFVHRKVEHYFKYRAEDVVRIRWERLNQRIGLCLGMVAGGVWFVALGLGIYVAGYPTVQLSSDGTSGLYRMLNMARNDLQATGLDKTVARFDPAPANYYRISDILGLLYNNPILVSRLSQYPPFLLTGEKTEFQAIANDKDFMNMLLSKADIAQIVDHANTKAVLANPEILLEFAQQDLKDIQTYLETGKSPKYDDERILGRWTIDLYSTIAQEKKRRPDITTTEMNKLKKQAQLLSNVAFVATTDNKAILKVELTEQQKQLLQAPPAAAATEPPGGAGAGAGMSPELAQRYGLNPNQRGGPRRPGAPTPQPVARPAAPTFTQLVFSAQGSWKKEGDNYVLALQDEKNQGQKAEAIADGERLTIRHPALTLVLAKVE